MALIGQGVWDVDVKLFDAGALDWPGSWNGEDEDDWTQNAYKLYSGQAYQLPADVTWVNKPTGSSAVNGVIMGFPRSAEANPDQAGTIKWYITES